MTQRMLFLMLICFDCNAMNSDLISIEDLVSIEDSDSEYSSDLLNDFLNNTELGSNAKQASDIVGYNHTILNSLSNHRKEICNLITREHILEEKQKNSDATIATLAANLNRLAIKIKEHDTKINKATQLRKRSTHKIFSHKSRTIDEKHRRPTSIATVLDTINPDGTITTKTVPAQDTLRDDDIAYSPGYKNLKSELDRIYQYSVRVYFEDITLKPRTWSSIETCQLPSLYNRIKSGEFADSKDMIALKNDCLKSSIEDVFRASDNDIESTSPVFKILKKHIHDLESNDSAIVIHTSNVCDFIIEQRKISEHFETNPECRYIPTLSINSPVQKQLRKELGELYISYQTSNAPDKYTDEFYRKKQQLLHNIAQGNFRDSSQEMEELTLACNTISNLLYQWASDPNSPEGKNLLNCYKAQCELPIYQRWFGYYEENMLNQGKQIVNDPGIWNIKGSTCCDVISAAAPSGIAYLYYSLLSLFGNC